MMRKITEVSRRSMYHEEKETACGRMSGAAVMAEIVVDADGRRVFLHGEWDDTAEDCCYEANRESLFDAYGKLFNAGNKTDEQKAIAERDRISKERIREDSVFEPYYAEMEQMILDEMKAHGDESFCEDEGGLCVDYTPTFLAEILSKLF